MIVDNDCEDQALVHTDVCLRWQCQTWERGADKPTQPKLEPNNAFGMTLWCCPKCGASYGETP